MPFRDFPPSASCWLFTLVLATSCTNAAHAVLVHADNPLAFDAFLSIFFAPQASAGSFDEMLRSIQRHGLPILLVYGREDPWVRTIWGQRIVRIVPEATFYQVTVLIIMPCCAFRYADAHCRGVLSRAWQPTILFGISFVSAALPVQPRVMWLWWPTPAQPLKLDLLCMCRCRLPDIAHRQKHPSWLQVACAPGSSSSVMVLSLCSRFVHFASTPLACIR
jgi:hypothetical protein